MRSIGVLIVRLVVGGLLAGHGAQKLFGMFGGPGLRGTAGWMESMRLRPGTAWARLAGGSELGGGLLTMLGFLNPLGPVAGIGAMGMAWAKVHLGKPVWVTKGGAELPLTNIAVLGAMALAGPGRLSLDGLLGIRIPRRIGFAALVSALGAVWLGAHRELQAGTSEPKAATTSEPKADTVKVRGAGHDAAAGVDRAGDAPGDGTGVPGDTDEADLSRPDSSFDRVEHDALIEADRETAAGALVEAVFAVPASADLSWTGYVPSAPGKVAGARSAFDPTTEDDAR